MNPSSDGSVSRNSAQDPRFLSLGEVRGLLPAVEGFRAVFDRVVHVAEPPASGRWSSAGELGTLDSRQIDPDQLDLELPSILEEAATEAARSAGVAVRLLRLGARGEVEAVAEALREEAEYLAGSGRLPDAEACIARALHLAEGFRDRRAALALQLAGARIARARGKHVDAEVRYEQALRMGTEGGALEVAVTAAVGLGNLEVDRGRWGRAAERYAHAERLLDDLSSGQTPAGDESVLLLRPERWHLALNRSILARETGELGRARDLLDEAERVAGELGDSSARPIVDNARGQLLLAMGDGGGAVRVLRLALEGASTPDARVTIGVNLAEALLAMGRQLEAGQAARWAEEVAVRAGVVSRLPEVYRVLGEVLASMGKPDAFLFHERALEMVRDHSLPDVERARVLESYARLALLAGRSDEARAHAAAARAIRERLHDAQPRLPEPSASGRDLPTDTPPHSWTNP